MSKLIQIATGTFLVFLGIVGLILPVMPGWVFLIPGLVILGRHFTWAQRLVDWLKARFEDARAVAGGKKNAEKS